MFAPGGFFTDVSGVPLSKDFYSAFFASLPQGAEDGIDAQDFRLKDDRSFFLNMGFEYKF